MLNGIGPYSFYFNKFKYILVGIYLRSCAQFIFATQPLDAQCRDMPPACVVALSLLADSHMPEACHSMNSVYFDIKHPKSTSLLSLSRKNFDPELPEMKNAPTVSVPGHVVVTKPAFLNIESI